MRQVPAGPLRAEPRFAALFQPPGDATHLRTFMLRLQHYSLALCHEGILMEPAPGSQLAPNRM
jgi:hypothetical protein